MFQRQLAATLPMLAVMLLMPVGLTLVFYVALGNLYRYSGEYEQAIREFIENRAVVGGSACCEQQRQCGGGGR